MRTDSGLEYEIQEEGTGAQPKPGDRVAVHYTGRFPEGRAFDSSLDRGEPLTFTLGRGEVIQGWDEGIALLREGGKARMWNW
jgi:FKBP-type peptidyl-prolyl cis-trans isomerase